MGVGSVVIVAVTLVVFFHLFFVMLVGLFVGFFACFVEVFHVVFVIVIVIVVYIDHCRRGIIGGVICTMVKLFVVGFACLFDGFVVAARRWGHDIAGAQRHYYRRRCYDYGCRKCGDEIGNVEVDAVSSGIY